MYADMHASLIFSKYYNIKVFEKEKYFANYCLIYLHHVFYVCHSCLNEEVDQLTQGQGTNIVELSLHFLYLSRLTHDLIHICQKIKKNL